MTGEQVYNIALVYIDEVTDTGQVLADEPDYYRTKATSILTVLQAELLPSTITPTVITDLSQELAVSDRVAITVLPYGLAAHLLIQEDTVTAAYFNNRYDELKSKQQATLTQIEDKYGVLGGMQ